MDIIDTIKQKMMSGSSFRRDVLWTLVTQILVMLLAFGITKIVSNILTIDEFGQYNVVRRSVSVISFVMLAGMGITLPRYLAIYQGARQYRKMLDLIHCSLLYVCIVCLIVFAVGFVCSDVLIQIVTGCADHIIYILALAFAFSVALSSLLVAYYRGINDFKNYSITQISLQFLLFFSLFFLPSHHVNTIFLLWFMVTFLFTFFYFLFENHRNSNIVFRAYRANQFQGMMNTIVAYSTPRLFGDFLLFSFTAFPVIYLSHVLTMADVAYYSIGITIVNMATPFFSFLGVVLLPYVSSSMSIGRFDEAKRLIHKLTWWYVVLALVLTYIFWLFMPYIIRLFFSPDYIVSKDVSRIILLSILPQSMYLLYRNPIDAVVTIPYNTLILLVSCLVLVVLFIFSESISEYSYSFVCASFVQGGLSMLVWLLIKNNIKK